MIIKTLCLIIFSLLFSLQSLADTATVSTQYTEANLSFSQKNIVTNPVNQTINNQVVWAKLTLNHRDGWHSYWKNPGDSGLPTKLKWTLPEFMSAGEMLWAHPSIFYLGPIVNFGYKKESTILIPITIKSSPDLSDIKINAAASWLVCKEECIPEKAEFTISMPLSDQPDLSSHSKTIHHIKDTLLMTPHIKTTFQIVNSVFELKLPSSLEVKQTDSVYFYPEQHNAIVYKDKQALIETNQDFFIQAEAKLNAPNQVTGIIQITSAEKTDYIRVVAEQDKPKEAVSIMAILTFLIFAFIGGLILNIMPCVFPVLSLKVLSIVQKAKQSHQKIKQEAIAYTIGVLSSFYVLVVLLLIFKTIGHQIGWGFQLQSPVFIYFMIGLMMLVGLNLNGLFELPSFLAAVPGKLGTVHTKTTTQNNQWGSFFTGVLAVIIATPCTAPFMAPAIGFAFTQSVFINVLIFTALGLGFSFPYLIIAYIPRLISFLPKPGQWMNTAKHVLAIPMYLTVVWLIAIFYMQLNIIGVVIALCLVLALISYCLSVSFESDIIKSIIKLIIVLLILGLSMLVSKIDQSTPKSTETKQIYQLNSALKNKEATFVDVTAAWCLSCKVNERLILDTPDIQDAFKDNNVNYIVLDWTNENEYITQYLASFDRQGVPLYVFYNKEGESKVLPQILTKKMVYDLFEDK